MSLKFQNLSSVLLPYEIILESLENSKKCKEKNISISPEMTFNILFSFILLYVWRVYTFFNKIGNTSNIEFLIQIFSYSIQ